MPLDEGLSHEYMAQPGGASGGLAGAYLKNSKSEKR